MQLLDRSWLYFPLTREIPPFFVEPHVLPTLHGVCSKPGQPNLPDCSISLLEVWWPHSGHHWGSGLHKRLGDKYELLMWITNTKSLCILKLVWLQGGLSWGALTFREPKKLLGLEWNNLEKILVSLLCHLVLASIFHFSKQPKYHPKKFHSLFWVTTFQYCLVCFFWPCNTPCGLWDLSPDQGSNSCPLQWKLGVLTTGIPIFRVKAEHPPLWFDCCVLSPTLSPVTCVTLHTSACLEWALSSPGPAELVRHTVLGPTPSLSDSVGLRWSQNLALVRYF